MTPFSFGPSWPPSIGLEAALGPRPRGEWKVWALDMALSVHGMDGKGAIPIGEPPQSYLPNSSITPIRIPSQAQQQASDSGPSCSAFHPPDPPRTGPPSTGEPAGCDATTLVETPCQPDQFTHTLLHRARETKPKPLADLIRISQPLPQPVIPFDRSIHSSLSLPPTPPSHILRASLICSLTHPTHQSQASPVNPPNLSSSPHLTYPIYRSRQCRPVIAPALCTSRFRHQSRFKAPAPLPTSPATG
ncbi:hypothetical protein B0J13DRAFT_309933 [Dactylonectria estremocensis]|uniref:Uncharacterized protein n=1 Tax=Dactylonectria estremocensis TaxID=1079267 RepID=A0A9P9J4H3_9HYPO|nr:hypothetical protein B0J13DRAFT_309933 [Dactylonectria estremocensis]